MLVTLHSNHFPGVCFVALDGSALELRNGIATEINPSEKENLLLQLRGFSASTASRIKLSFSDPSPAALAPITASVAAEAVTPPSELFDGAELSSEDELVLSEDDHLLVLIEVEKLHSKKIEEGEPIVIATGTNPDLPIALRRAYLTAVIADPEIQKGLKKVAEKTLEQL